MRERIYMRGDKKAYYTDMLKVIGSYPDAGFKANIVICRRWLVSHEVERDGDSGAG